MTSGSQVARRSGRRRTFTEDCGLEPEKITTEAHHPPMRLREEKMMPTAFPPSPESSSSSEDNMESQRALYDGLMLTQPALTLQDGPQPRTDRDMCVPDNLGIIWPGLYRSSFPGPEHWEYLGGLGLKTIVTLVAKDEIPDGYQTFMTKMNVRHVAFDVPSTKKGKIDQGSINSIAEILLDRRNYPLLIHCNHGKHRTGCVVAVLRKMTGWDVPSIEQEYRVYAHPKERPGDIAYIRTLGDLSLRTVTGYGRVQEVLNHGLNPFNRPLSPMKLRRMLYAALLVMVFMILCVTRFRVYV